jgi:hypothetical protein
LRGVTRLLLAALTAGTLAGAPPAGAATLRTRPCPRYIKGAPARYVSLTGTGFTPHGAVAVGYAARPPAGRAHPDVLRADARGNLAGRASGPEPGALRGYVNPFVLTATDVTNPALAATARLSVVRLAVRLPRITRPHAVVTFRLYGFPDASVVWAHYFFAGHPVTTTRMGRTRGACGLVRRRQRYLPARIRYGRWHLYLSVRQRFTRADARRRRYVLAGSFRVLRRRFFAQPRAAMAPEAIRWTPGVL